MSVAYGYRHFLTDFVEIANGSAAIGLREVKGWQ
jgi:hypothetical protein